MARIRYHVAPRDAPPAIAARTLGMTAEAFATALPALLARGFPPADPTTGNFDLKAIGAWQDGRHPRLLLGEGTANGNQAIVMTREVLRERLREQGERADAELKAAAMTKRERDALAFCQKANGTFVNVDRFWRRTIGWLTVRGLIEAQSDQDSRCFARITPAGEAEWLRRSNLPSTPCPT